MRKASIRIRLTIWYGGVVAAVLLTYSAAVYFTMRHQMLSRIDHGLREEMADVLSEVERAENRAGMLKWLDRRFGRHQGFDFQITTTRGKLVFANARLGNEMLPIPSDLALKRDEFVSEQRKHGPRRRIITRKVKGPEGSLRVQIARSLENYDHEMKELFLALLVGGPLTLVVTLSGGYFLARRALAPVDRMTEMANRIEAKRLDQRLEIIHSNDELGRLAITLNGMLDRLERSFREMQRFTADASHELRTPIAAIRTEAEVALNHPVSDEEKRELLSNILEECQRLTWITNQLLTLSREDAGITQFRREPIDLAQLANEAGETMRPLTNEQSVSLTVRASGAAVVHGDADRLRQVVYNLLDNAIKYTPKGGRVTLVVERVSDSIRLAVSDTGVGIPDEHLPHVFERFYRADKARERAAGGSGLGLSIVASITTAHGGRVEIHSQPKEGTTVSVWLPTTTD